MAGIDNAALMDAINKLLQQGGAERSATPVGVDQETRDALMGIVQQQLEYYDSDEYKQQQALQNELTQTQLESIRAAKELGGVSGELSASDMEALNTMEQNAITTLTETLNRDMSRQYMPDAIAQLVDRGVLQGDVGAQATAEVLKRRDELLAEGTREFSTRKMESQLNLTEAERNRRLQLLQLAQQGLISADQLKQQWVSGATDMMNSQEALSQNWQNLAQQWDTSKLGIASDLFTRQAGLEAGLQDSAANRALQLQIANMQQGSSNTASKWNAIGNVGSGILAGIISNW
jgi:hypothetical protein